MLAKDLISDVITAIRTSDSGITALSYMDIFKISHLPIVNNSEFLGLISDKDIYDLNMVEEPIGNHNLSLNKTHVTHHQHIYDVLDLFAKHKLSIVPVLDDRNNFLGVISQLDIIHFFAKLIGSDQPGGIIVLELNERDYSLTQIAQIIEGNDSKIINLYLTSNENSTKNSLTIKVNRTDLSAIIQTFNRYNYTIQATYSETEVLANFIEDRFELFLRYLNV